MDAQLRGLEGKLEKSLAAQAELEHRRQQITAELNKGFEPATRYEELRFRLNTLNRELTKAGVEIEISPELSNLDEEAFRPVEPGVSVHQILSLAEPSCGMGEEKATAVNDQAQNASGASVIESEGVIAVTADLLPAQGYKSADDAYTKPEAARESKNGFLVPPEEDRAGSATAAKRGAVSKSAAASGSSQQMCFVWSRYQD